MEYFGYFDNYDGATFKRRIHTPSIEAKKSLIYLQEAGELESIAKHKGERAKLDSYLFFIVLNGSGSITYGGRQTNLKKHDCVFIDCNIPYSHCSSEQDQWKLGWVHFHGKPAEYYYNNFKQYNQLPYFHSDHPIDFINILQQLMVSSGNLKAQDILNAKLLTDLCTICIDSILPKLRESNMLAVAQYIDANYFKKLSLEDIANNFYISKFALAHKFKEQFGITVGEYITKKRVTVAKELLRYSNKSTSEISIDCGVDDPNYFTKIFKKSEGCSPRDYRNKW